MTTIAHAVGYAGAELSGVPEGANLGLSCGNPTAIASLKPGETVLDLGSGGGFDCFIAGPKVGASGRVIGVDMTPDMLSRARRNLDAYRASSGLDNVEFRLGEIENLPVADASVDVLISNCVLNPLAGQAPRVARDRACSQARRKSRRLGPCAPPVRCRRKFVRTRRPSWGASPAPS